MANRQIQGSHQIHGTNPQYLLDTIIRQKIYANQYWKEQLFAVNAETLVDKSIAIDHIGGMYGGVGKPTKFLCLVLKMLQLQPEKEIVLAFIQNEDYKYSTALGLFYLRLTGKPDEIYQILEQFYSDNRKLIIREKDGKYVLQHMDEFIDCLLNEDIVFDIVLPRIPKRIVLEESGELEPRVSPLEKDLEKELQELYNQEQQIEDEKKKKLLEQDENNEDDKKGKNEDENDKEKEKKKKKHKHHRSSYSRSRSRERKKWRKVVNKKEKDRKRSKSRSKSRSRQREKHREENDKKNNKNQKQQQYQEKEKEPEEGSVEYWNKIRAGLGMKLLEK